MNTRRNAYFFAALWLFMPIAIVVAACTAQQRRQAETALQAAEAGCLMVRGLHIDQTTEDVCVATEELRRALELYLRARREAPAASAPAAN
jgi:hypothetical protein